MVQEIVKGFIELPQERKKEIIAELEAEGCDKEIIQGFRTLTTFTEQNVKTAMFNHIYEMVRG